MKSSIMNQRPLPVWKRRTAWLALIPTAAILCLAAMPLALSDEANIASNEARLEGSWLIILDGPPPWPGMMSFSAGGALVATDSSVPPALGNVYQGTWTKTGSREFTDTFLGFQYDAAGVLEGYFRVHETIRLDPSGNAYDVVTATGEILDLNQNVVFVVFSGPGAAHATRINAE